jgi:flagellar assembly factor FliW
MTESVRRADADPGASTARAISFPDGLIGCPNWHSFVLEPDAVGPAVQVLRCLDDTQVSIFVADPFTILPEYEFEIADEDAAGLDLQNPGEALVFVALTIQDDVEKVTANLLGPIVINVRTGLARQLVLAASNYSVRHPVLG